MKVKLKKEYIISELKKNYKTALESGEVSIINNTELDPECYPKVVIDYVKDNIKNKIICFHEGYSIDEVFTLGLFKTSFRYDGMYAQELFSQIFKDDKAKLSGECPADFIVNYDELPLDNSDEDNTGDTCTYEIYNYYIHLYVGGMGGGTAEDIFEVDENNELILPEINDVELEVEKDHIIDSVESRQLFLENL